MKFDMDAYVSLALDPDSSERDHFLGMSLVFAEMVADGLGLKDYRVVPGEGDVSLVSGKVNLKLVQGIFDSVLCGDRHYRWEGVRDFGGFLKFLKKG